VTFLIDDPSFCLQGRDLSIAYVLVALTYMVVGAVFFISFPLNKDCIEDVILLYQICK
jgi:hypothetical protein